MGYSGGMMMPGRNYSTSPYRYGAANGQEKSTELNENSYTAEYWQYDARLVRRWNVDPITKDDESPYMVYGNNPIVMVDPDGSDWYENTKTGSVEYKGKWHNKHKGYKHLGAGNGDVLVHNGKEYNKKTGEVTAILDNVVVTADKPGKKKQQGPSWLSWPDYTKAQTTRWDGFHAMLRDRHADNQPLVQPGDPQDYKDNFDFYQRSWQANEDWRATNYMILDMATVFVPVPKVGMVRWIRPFGNAAGRVFWSGGGVTGRAFAAATEHALLTGGTTLEMTTAGRVLTYVTEKVGSNAMTGKMWGWASKQFAKGAVGDVHMFMDYSKISPYNFWYTRELPTLLEKGSYIITHFR